MSSTMQTWAFAQKWLLRVGRVRRKAFFHDYDKVPSLNYLQLLAWVSLI